MVIENTPWLNLAAALGIGLLIGAERERSKGTGPQRAAAGLRTFTIASLLGAISILFDFWLLIVSVICVMIFVTVAYFSNRNNDPGLTTEIALVFTVILGGLAMSQIALAAAVAVAVAILLAAKEPLHGFVLGVITKNELNDLLVLAAATLIILPLVPNQFMGPFDAINPRNLWLIVILIMSISALGHIALRWLGGHIGLPIVGLLSGFISSIATIGSMGERAKASPAIADFAASGAVLSSVATMLQLAVLLATIHPPTLYALAWPLTAGGVVAAGYGAVLSLRSHRKIDKKETYHFTQSFSVKTALMLTLVFALVLVVSAALKAWFGEAGLLVASGVAGLGDVHASTVSVASLAAANKLGAENTVLPILVAISVNTISKAIMAMMSKNKAFATQVIACQMIQVVAIWAVWWL